MSMLKNNVKTTSLTLFILLRKMAMAQCVTEFTNINSINPYLNNGL
jgi:hypothetical protein